MLIAQVETVHSSSWTIHVTKTMAV